MKEKNVSNLIFPIEYLIFLRGDAVVLNSLALNLFKATPLFFWCVVLEYPFELFSDKEDTAEMDELVAKEEVDDSFRVFESGIEVEGVPICASNLDWEFS